MTDVKPGDRVRVVLEGEAKSPRFSDNGFLLGSNSENLIVPGWDHVVSVEVLAKPFKVGDTVSDDDYAKLPVGTVARSGGGKHYHKISSDKWISPHNVCPSDELWDNRTIVYLPDAS